MWFKNLTLFRLAGPLAHDPESLAAALAAHAFRPCGALEPSSLGWSPPLGRHGTALTHAAAGCIAICAQREERVLPPSVVRDEVEARAAAIEGAEGRPVRAPERRRLREQVTFELLPRAFTRRRRMLAYLAPADGWLAIDTATEKRAEELTVLLGHTVPGIALEPLEATRPASGTLTRWLAGERLPPGFALGDRCELRDPAQRATLVRCQGQDLASDEVRAHLAAHKQAHRLGLLFEDRVSFVLGADLVLRRLRFADLVEHDPVDAGDEVARLDADFALMTGELRRLLARLLASFEDEVRAA